jgi:hypothetical protein
MPRKEKRSGGLLDEAFPEPSQPHAQRRSLSSALLCCFLLVVCYLAWSDQPAHLLKTHYSAWIYASPDSLIQMTSKGHAKHPVIEFGQYQWHQDLKWSRKRLVVIGDVHGQVDALKSV